MSRTRTLLALAVLLGAAVTIALIGRMEPDPQALLPDPTVAPPTRACCAFGYELRLDNLLFLRSAFRPSAWAFFRGEGADHPEISWSTARGGFLVHNVVEPGELGSHSYTAAGRRAELSGLVYSCRGGFVDVGHLRDGIDRMLYWSRRLEPLLSGTVRELEVELPAGDGTLTRTGSAAPAPEEARTRAVARFLYDVFVWHEIASWYGYESFPGFPERHSAFTPDDLYSDLLGIEIGSALVAGAVPPDAWNASAGAAIGARLAELGALPAEATRRALDAVEGVWWDREVVLPANRSMLRREPSLDPSLVPWRIGQLQPCLPGPGAAVPEALLSGPPLLALEIRPSGPVAASLGRATLTPASFPTVVGRIREEMRRELGADAVSSSPPPEPSSPQSR